MENTQEELQLRIARLEDCLYKLLDNIYDVLDSEGIQEKYETMFSLKETTLRCRVMLIEDNLCNYL
jgi:hypothetical protein